MKLGITVPNYGKFADRESILKISTAAEKLGYDSLWVSDHIVLPTKHKGFGNVFYDPLVTLSYIAGNTDKISLGTSVMVVPYRNPVVLAKQISTIDVMSGGRVILGIGSGWLREEFEALGVNYSERGKITDEYLEIFKELYTKELPEFNGRYFNFNDINFNPKPVQKPFPPVWVGGSSRPSLVRSVKYGNGWHAVGSTPGEIKTGKSTITELLKKYQRENDEFVISVRKNIQITERNIKDEREILRGNIDKIGQGLTEYKKAGVNHLVLQVLATDFNSITNTMEKIGRLKNIL